MTRVQLKRDACLSVGRLPLSKVHRFLTQLPVQIWARDLGIIRDKFVLGEQLSRQNFIKLPCASQLESFFFFFFLSVLERKLCVWYVLTFIADLQPIKDVTKSVEIPNSTCDILDCYKQIRNDISTLPPKLLPVLSFKQ